MHIDRFPIAGLMGAIVVVAIVLAAMRNASPTWAGVTFLLTDGVLCLAVVGVVCRNGSERAWWLGFALFGWGYLELTFWSTFELPTMALLDAIGADLGMQPRYQGGMVGWGGGGFGGSLDRELQQIGHCLWVLLAAILGGILAGVLFGGREKLPEKSRARTQVAARTARRRRPWTALLGLAGCVLIGFLGLIASRSAPEFWAGAIFLLTCGLLGMTVLGVAGSRGNRRQIWLGAAIFGVGYMTLALGRSLIGRGGPSADRPFAERRPSRSLRSSSVPQPPRSARPPRMRQIWDALGATVPMRFRTDTPLQDVLKFIESATHGTDGKGVPSTSTRSACRTLRGTCRPR